MIVSDISRYIQYAFSGKVWIATVKANPVKQKANCFVMRISLNYLRVFRTCTIFFLFQEYTLQDLVQSQWFNAGSLSSSVYYSIFSQGLEGEGRGLRESASLPPLSLWPTTSGLSTTTQPRRIRKTFILPGGVGEIFFSKLFCWNLMIYPRSEAAKTVNMCFSTF